MTKLDQPSGFDQVLIVANVVATKGRFGLMTADLHGYMLRDSRPHHAPHTATFANHERAGSAHPQPWLSEPMAYGSPEHDPHSDT